MKHIEVKRIKIYSVILLYKKLLLSIKIRFQSIIYLRFTLIFILTVVTFYSFLQM